MAFAVLNAKEPMPWPMSKITPALARFDHRLAHGAVRGRRVVGKGTEAVGEDVALAHAREHVLEGRRRMVDMNHHRQPELLRRLPRDVERDKAGILRSMQADADFDADDRVAGWLRATSIASIGAISLRSPPSPTITRFEKPYMPANETLR